MQYAEAHFALSTPDPATGKTRLQTLRDIQRQTGITAPELAALPELPAGAAHVWEWFCEIGAARGAGWTLNPISWADMAAYWELMRVKPAVWEVLAVRRLDEAFLMSRLEPKKKAANARQLFSNVGHNRQRGDDS